ncbi:MAG: PEP-CTERM sorting domain-containing protein [Aquabacterium sp.]
MKLQHIAAAVALVAAGAANASIVKMDGGEAVAYGDSSVLLVMLDSTGAQTRGLTIDLGFSYSDFAVPYTGSLGPVPAAGTLLGPDTSVTWDFSANTITLNGSVLSGMTNDWSSQVEDFLANSQLAETKFALVAGSTRGTGPGAFLATGTPTASQLSSQNSSATANFALVAPLFTNNNTRGTHASADNGAYSMASTDVGYVGTDYAATTSIGGWKNNLKWNGWTSVGGRTNVRQLLSNGQERIAGDTSTFAGGVSAYDTTGLLNNNGTLALSADGRTLTWNTAVSAAPIPEPESYALALLGLAAAGFVARRRAK